MSDIKAHLFPFSVDLEGPVKSKEYLNVEKIEDGQYETVIMGRHLVGHPVPIQGTTQGHIWKKDNREYEDEEMDELEGPSQTIWRKTKTTVDEFILWKKDKAPEKQDPRIKALENWLAISQSIHESIPL